MYFMKYKAKFDVIQRIRYIFIVFPYAYLTLLSRSVFVVSRLCDVESVWPDVDKFDQTYHRRHNVWPDVDKFDPNLSRIFPDSLQNIETQSFYQEMHQKQYDK